MKTTIAALSAATLILGAIPSHADILAGPFTNPVNGHDYYLLTPNSWMAAEAEAERLGGTLAIIQNAAEEEWVYSKFGTFGGTANRNLWIGLRRETPGGPFTWVTGAKPDYTDWSPGEPDNGGGNESYVHLWSHSSTSPGKWNDAANYLNLDGSMANGVVEVPGKETSLNDKERSMIGTWYEGGKRDRPCYIAGTKNVLFQICDSRAVRLYITEGSVFLMNGIRGDMVQDKILWTNGTWWSR
jgi:hypothetical protein